MIPLPGDGRIAQGEEIREPGVNLLHPFDRTVTRRGNNGRCR